MKEVMEGTCIRLLGTKIAYPESGKTINLPTVSTATATAADEPSDAGDNEHGGSDHRNELTPEVKTCLEDERANREDSEKDQLTQKKQEHDSSPMADSDGNPKNPMDEDTSKTKTEEHKALKKPDKIVPCPRCNSMDTKFCYYNNYNVNQPRHFCKSCQRYWTAGGNMRSMPVGAGRRKNKNPVSHCRFLTIPQEAFQAARIEAATASNGVHSVHPQILSFGPDSTHVDKAHISAVSCRGRENTDDCSSGSTVTTSNSVTENMLDRNGFHSHVPCIPGVSWSYNPWNSATPIPVSMPIYPSTYWNYIPWLPQLSHIQSQNMQSSSFILGKHSRDGELINPNGCEESKKQKNSVLIPKILRIDDPDEAAKSSIWATLGIKNENVNRGGVFKAFQTKSDENKKHPASTTSPVLQANPAALSRSLYFQERA